MSLKQELEALFGEETVRMAMIQEILAQRYIQQNPAKVRENLQRFEKLKTFDKQKAFVASFTPEMSRAIICALLCNSASKVVADLGAHAVLDKRMGRAVLGGKIISR
ncbi:MAG: hypothetical protein GC154_03875 [bacterium]|nr:hypothetical protein [bacterium]